jgi:hypothetical protein
MLLLPLPLVAQSGINKWWAKVVAFVTVPVKSMINSASTIPNVIQSKHDTEMYKSHLTGDVS